MWQASRFFNLIRPFSFLVAPWRYRGFLNHTLAILAVITFTGCAAEQAATLDQARASYGQGNYTAAYSAAAPIADDGTSTVRYEAAYLAGASADRLRNAPAAQRYLSIAAGSGDPAVSGKALATLGLMQHEQGRYAEAYLTLRQAADRLTGEDRANAHYYAGVSLQKLGRWGEARQAFNHAHAASGNPEFRRRVADELMVSGYTLQTGAYADDKNARTAAQALANQTSRLGFGLPRVVPARDDRGRTLFLVQIGQFPNMAQAMAARDQLGKSRAFIVPASR